MKRDAKEHESEDKKRREEVDTKNQADQLIFQSEKQLKEFDAKLNAETKMKIQTGIDRLKEVQKATNIDEIKSAMEALNAAWNEASSQMYSQATDGQKDGQQSGGQEGFGSQAETHGDGAKQDDQKVENADFEVVDEKDKDKK